MNDSAVISFLDFPDFCPVCFQLYDAMSSFWFYDFAFYHVHM